MWWRRLTHAQVLASGRFPSRDHGGRVDASVVLLLALGLSFASCTNGNAAPAGTMDPAWLSYPDITDATTPGVHPGAHQGDEIFTPHNVPVAKTDRSDRLWTVEIDLPEPRFAGTVASGAPTGSRYELHFPNRVAGGECKFTGKGRYVVSNAQLDFQVMSECADLHNAYQFHVCRLGADLRCKEAPWWYFRGRQYLVTEDGVTVEGTKYSWVDQDKAPGKLRQQLLRAVGPPHASGQSIRGRSIHCRAYHPQSRSYDLHNFATQCLIQSLCSAMPDVSGLRDGEEINLQSSVGDFIRKQAKTGDTADWSCWMITQQ